MRTKDVGHDYGNLVRGPCFSSTLRPVRTRPACSLVNLPDPSWARGVVPATLSAFTHPPRLPFAYLQGGGVALPRAYLPPPYGGDMLPEVGPAPQRTWVERFLTHTKRGLVCSAGGFT